MTPEIKYRISCELEDLPVRGNACASGDEAQDKEVEDRVLAELEHNPWAWCSVGVTVTIRVDVDDDYFTFIGHDHLGCCSYKSQADFEADGYFEDMKKNALVEAKLEMERSVKRGQTAAELLKVLQSQSQST